MKPTRLKREPTPIAHFYIPDKKPHNYDFSFKVVNVKQSGVFNYHKSKGRIIGL